MKKIRNNGIAVTFGGEGTDLRRMMEDAVIEAVANYGQQALSSPHRSSKQKCGCHGKGEIVIEPKTSQARMNWAQGFGASSKYCQIEGWRDFLPVRDPETAQELWNHVHPDVITFRDQKKSGPAKRKRIKLGIVTRSVEVVVQEAHKRNRVSKLLTHRRERILLNKKPESER